MASAVYSKIIEKLRAYQRPASDPDACWDWAGGRVKSGYASIRIDDRQVYAHRLSYQINIGPIPDGLWVLHTCDNPPCTNPRHLYAGTPSKNAQDREQRGRGGSGRKGSDRKAPLPRKPHRRFYPISISTAKLTTEIAEEIRRIYAQGGITHRQLAEQFGVAHGRIGAVIRGTAWPVIVDGQE